MTGPDLRALARGIPKAELHVHVEGTLEPELAFELAAANGVRLPYADATALARAYEFTNLGSFLAIYYEASAALVRARDFEHLAEAYFTRAAADGVRHVEMFFDLQSHLARGVPARVVFEGLWSAVAGSQQRHGISSSLILCFLRDLGPAAAEEALDAALPFVDRFDGVGLDSAEVGFPPAPFAAVFARAASLGLRRVAHAGEEGPPSYIADALNTLGIERIDHGLRVLEDEALTDRLVREKIPLTVCPLSNVRLRCVAELSEHPLARMLELGLRVTVNSDDPAYFGGYIGDNYVAVQAALKLTAADIVTLASNSFESAFFLDDADRLDHLRELKEFEQSWRDGRVL